MAMATAMMMSAGIMNRFAFSMPPFTPRPTMTNKSQNATAQLPATSDITLSQPAGLGLNAVMNSSAATSTNSMTGSQKWNFFMTTTSVNSSGA